MFQSVSLSTLIARVRRDTRTATARSNLVTDTELLDMANRILDEECRAKMIEIECSLVYSSSSIATVAGTGSYLIPVTHDGMLDSGVWITDPADVEQKDYLAPCNEEEKYAYLPDTADNRNQPEYYYLTPDDYMGLLPIPDAVYTVNFMYWVKFTPLTAVSGIGSTLPWGGIWNAYLTKRLEYEVKGRYEMDISRVAAELVGIEAAAISSCYRRGIRHHRHSSDMFDVEGC